MRSFYLHRIEYSAAILIFGLILALAAAPPAQAEPFPRETPVVRAVRLAGPAVVNISTKEIVRERFSPFGNFGGDSFFDQFFRDFFEVPGERERARNSLGSGVIIDGRGGYIVTNEHVILRASEITVILGDEREYTAALVGSDPDSDLAILKIEAPKNLPSLTMGDSSDLMIGETVIAIGNPFGLSHTVTTGVISAVNRQIRTNNRVYRNFIQTDASINPGNSGGPLLNINGELIGINTAIYAQANGIGFAIAINKAKRIFTSLISYGEVRPIWLGLSLQDLTEHLRLFFKTPTREGVVITEVAPDGPAAGSGLKNGDVLVRIGDDKVGSLDDYEDILRSYTDQDKIRLVVFRGPRSMEFALRARAFPLEKARKLSLDNYGLSVGRNGLSDGEQAGVRIQNVRDNSPASRLGLQPGDIIHQVNEIKIKEVNDYLKAITKYRLRQSLSMVVQRGRYAYHITLTQ